MAIGAERIYHVNVNCRDLDRSLDFYRDVVGLVPMVRTAPGAQPGTGFGLDVAQWDAWILAGSRGTEGIVLDLLQWLRPPPVGVPAAPTDRGFTSLVIRHPDLGQLHRALGDAGLPPPAPPSDGVLMALDPDGTALRFREGGPPELEGVVIGSADPDRARRFFSEVMGLRVDGARCVDLATGFSVELAVVATPAGHDAVGRRANQLGIFRMAWITDDIDRDHARLAEAGVACYSPPVELDMNLGEHSILRAVFFEDPDGACLELIEPPDVGARR